MPSIFFKNELISFINIISFFFVALYIKLTNYLLRILLCLGYDIIC